MGKRGMKIPKPPLPWGSALLRWDDTMLVTGSFKSRFSELGRLFKQVIKPLNSIVSPGKHSTHLSLKLNKQIYVKVIRKIYNLELKR